jgi:hypothetical protein
LPTSNVILLLLDSSHGPQEGGFNGGDGSSGEVEMQGVDKRLRRDWHGCLTSHEASKKAYQGKRKVMGYPAILAAPFLLNRRQR